MNASDPQMLGSVAAGLRLATFVCRDMRRLRLLALALALAAYGPSSLMAQQRVCYRC